MKQRMKFVGCLVAVLLVCVMPAASQSRSIERTDLKVTDSIVVTGMNANPAIPPLHCDSNGNVYIRFYNPRNYFGSPVLRISSDGEKTQSFPLASAAGFEKADINNFAVAPDGSVALAVWGPKPDDGNILVFKSDGTFDPDAIIKMGHISVDQISVFTNGNLLISGTRQERIYGKTEPPVSDPFTEVVDDVGDVIKNVTLPGDYKPPKPSSPGFKKSLYTEPAEITLGEAISASDGNAYLERHTAKPTIYAISSDGSLLRTLHLVPPTKSAQLGVGIYYSEEGGGQLAVPFRIVKPIPLLEGAPKSERPGMRTVKQFISVYSAQTGKRLADYVVPPDIGAGLACYTPSGFTFIGSTKQHQLELKFVNHE